MNKIVSILLFLFTTVLCSSCSKDAGIYDSIDYSKYVTIKQGLWGSCIFREGDWQPGPGKVGKAYPVKRTIYIYQITSTSQTIQIGGANSSLFSQINTALVTQTESNDIGFYQVELPAGQYSLFIKEDGKYYSNSWDGQDNITPVTINANATTQRNLLIDYMAVY